MKGMKREEAYRLAMRACEETWNEKICKQIREALEQKSVLDKIRAEIEQLRLHKAEYLTNDNKVCIDSQAVLDIIDKYKAESEG